MAVYFSKLKLKDPEGKIKVKDDNGNLTDTLVLPMYSSYNFDLKKIYKTDAKRTMGEFELTFSDVKGLIPYFEVRWNYIPYNKYIELMKFFKIDKVIVEDYLDVFDGELKIFQFAIQQPKYEEFYKKLAPVKDNNGNIIKDEKTGETIYSNQIVGVIGLEIIFDGTKKYLSE